jgi:hypothetical protein
MVMFVVRRVARNDRGDELLTASNLLGVLPLRHGVADVSVRPTRVRFGKSIVKKDHQSRA